MRVFALTILILALVLVQVLLGGAGLAYGLPANLLLGLAGVLLVFVRGEKAASQSTFWSAVATLALAGYVIGRSILSPVEYLARWDLFLTLGVTVTYFMVGWFFSHARQRLVMVGFLVSLALVHVVVGVIQFRQHDNYMLIPWMIRSDWEWRASGLYIYPNHLAGLLEMICFLALGVCCWGRVQNWVRILGGYCALMCVVGIALTGSRGGYLSTLVGFVVFCGISLWAIRRVRPDRQWPVTLAVVLGVVLLIGGALFFMLRSSAISERVETVYDPTNMRLLMWKSALQQFQLSPWVGTGSGTFLFYAREFRDSEVQADPIFVHNDYLHLLAEYGVIGAVLGAIFLGFHLYSGFRGLRRIVNSKLKQEWRTSSNELALVMGALCGVAALLVHSVVDFNFHLPGNALIGAILFAILAAPSADLKPLGEKPRRGTAWLPWVVPVAAVAILILAVPLMPGEYYCELARRAVRDRRYAEGQALAEKALSYERKNPNLYFHLGEARHFQTQNMQDPIARAAMFEQAAEAYEEGLKLFPRDTRLLLMLGRTLDLAGRFDYAEEIFQRAFAGDPNFGNVYAYYGLHLKLQRRLPEAEFYLRKANELHELELSVPALAEIEAFKKSEMGKGFFPATDPPPAR
ncbi:MAG: O-antigen ligase family protein [Chthoniobacter sp.]|nr:O-antigen ligase family protein [Chthoniobacter sp.]